MKTTWEKIDFFNDFIPAILEGLRNDDFQEITPLEVKQIRVLLPGYTETESSDDDRRDPYFQMGFEGFEPEDFEQLRNKKKLLSLHFEFKSLYSIRKKYVVILKSNDDYFFVFHFNTHKLPHKGYDIGPYTVSLPTEVKCDQLRGLKDYFNSDTFKKDIY